MWLQQQITFSSCNTEYGHEYVALSDNDVSLLWFFPLRFDIVLMKEGRMKGQAFVGLPSEQSAEKALRDTNGYVLFDKPLVVVSFYPLSQDETRAKIL